MAAYFTITDLLALWRSCVDELYAQPFLEAGDGGGLEAFNQAFAQFERVSQAINVTMQEMFILPHSGQTADSAGGERRATVTLNIERDSAFQFPLLLRAVDVQVEAVDTDHSYDGPVQVSSGRTYELTQNVVLAPGVAGPIQAPARATAPGRSFNNPLPGTITSFVQPGATQHSTQGSVEAGDKNDVLYAKPDECTFAVGHVGQYVIFETGSNAGKVRRAVGYVPPSNLPIEHSGGLVLSQDVVMTVGLAAAYVVGEPVADSVTLAWGTLRYYDPATGTVIVERERGCFSAGGNLAGSTSGVVTLISSVSTVGMLIGLYNGNPPPNVYQTGETVTQAATSASGVVVRLYQGWTYLTSVLGTFTAGNPVVGTTSTVSMTPTVVGVEPSLVPEWNVTGWRVLDWGDDLGLSVTNAASPSGGRLGLLDELGRERNIGRGDGELDLDYAQRINQLPDVVSPNALRRACARAFTMLGLSAEYREVGTVQFPGFFYDVPSTDAPTFAFAYDMDFTLRPQDRFRTYLNYEDFRAFFLVGVPATGEGEFGFGYDAHPRGFYDTSTWLSFYDGCPAGEAARYRALWNDLTQRKAAGVGFDFYRKL